MNQEEIFKTQEELLKEKDIQAMVSFLTAKSNILNVIGIDKFLDTIKDIINKSEVFDFRSQMSADYIDKNNPVFIIKEINPKNVEIKTDKDLSDYMDEATNLVYEEIIKPTGILFEEFIDNAKDQLHQFTDSDRELVVALFSSMFGITIGNPGTNNIHIRMII